MNLSRAGVALAAFCCVASTTADRPRLVVQRAEANQFWSSAADAALYVSVTPADHLNVWNARDGTLERTIVLPHQSVPWTYAESPAAVVSRDGRFAAVRVGEDRVDIVRTVDGGLSPLATPSAGRLFPLAVSPDGSALAVEVEPVPDPHTGRSEAGHVALVAVADGRTLRTFPDAATAAFSADGRMLAMPSDTRNRLLLYDLAGMRMRALGDGGGVYGPIIFSPDGTTVATSGDGPAIPPRGGGTFDPSSTAHDLVVKLWDVRAGRLRSRFPGMRTWPMNPLDERAAGTFAFADAGTLAVRTDSAISVYTTSDSPRLEGRTDFGKAGSPDVFRVAGALGFVVRHDTTLSFDRWTGQTNSAYASVPFVGGFGTSLTLDPAGRNLIIAEANGVTAAQAYRLDLRTLELTKTRHGPVGSKPPRFLADGRLAFIAPSEVAFVDLQTEKLLRHPVPAQPDPHAYVDTATSGDGQTLFVAQPTIAATPGSTAPSVRAYDTATGKERFALRGFSRVPDACSSGTPRCAFIGVRWSHEVPSDMHAPVSLTVIDSQTGHRISERSLPTRDDGAGFIDSGRELVVRGQAFTRMQGDSLAIVDPERGVVERTFATVDGRLAFADSGPYVALVRAGGVTVYDSGGRLVQTIADKPMPDTNAVVFWPGGAKLAILRSDGTVAVRDTASGQLLATLVFFVGADGLEWLAYTRDDDYAGTPYAVRAIRWRVGDAILPASSFAHEFNRPERVAAALR